MNTMRAGAPVNPCYGWCSASTISCAIAPDGTVLPCAFFAPYPEFWAESILKEDLMKIWNGSETMKKLRKVKIKGKCETCEYNGSCYKGCHAIKYALHRNIFIPDCRCWYIPSDRERESGTS